MDSSESQFSKPFHVRWADCDFNGHMRHSAFYDYAGHVRVMLFTEFGLPMEKLIGMGIGPILLREECNFYRELRMNEPFNVDCEITAMRHSGKIWKMHHRFYKENGELAAELKVDGCWIDMEKRKSVSPTKDVLAIINKMPRSRDFVWLGASR